GRVRNCRWCAAKAAAHGRGAAGSARWLRSRPAASEIAAQRGRQHFTDAHEEGRAQRGAELVLGLRAEAEHADLGTVADGNERGRADACRMALEQDLELPGTQPADHRLAVAQHVLELADLRRVALQAQRRPELDFVRLALEQDETHRVRAEAMP